MTVNQDTITYIDQRLSDAESRCQQRFMDAELRNQQKNDSDQRAIIIAATTVDRALSKAESATEKRFESVNEFRAQLADQTATFFPRTEYETNYRGLTEKLDLIRINMDEKIEHARITSEDKLNQVKIVIDEKLSTLDNRINTSYARLDVNTGASNGMTNCREYFIALTVISTLVVTIILHFI